MRAAARAGTAWLPVYGWYRVSMRLNRYFWGMTLFGGIGLPLIVQLAFGQQLDPAGRSRLLIGNAILGLGMVVLRRVSFGLVVDRSFGHRDLVATTGLSRGGYLAAYGLEALSLALLPLAVVAAGFALPGVTPPTALGWLVPYLLIAVAFCSLGMIFGSVSDSMPVVAMLANVAVVVCVALCPVSYPAERVPALLAPLVNPLPPSLAAELIAALWHGGTLLDPRLLFLAAWSAGLAWLAWRVVPWTDRA